MSRTNPWLEAAPDRPDAARLGGKGAGLVWLAGHGQAVPPFAVVPVEAFRVALAEAGVEAWLRETLATLTAAKVPAVATAIAERLAGLRVPAALRDALAAAVPRLAPGGEALAVRSSASDEDGTGGSFAGLHATCLAVRGVEALGAAVVDVWRSAFSPQTLAYRCQRGLRADRIAMAVVVQRMIAPRVSGVCFTAEAVSGDPEAMTISAVWGAGEGLVSGALDADTWTWRKADGAVTAQLVHKAVQLLPAPGGGVVSVPVPEADQDRPCLDAGVLAAIAAAGQAIERAAGRPQDIEWCTDPAGTLFLLQARPIASVVEYGPAAGQPLLWDNANIVESYAGVTTPLTFSFIRRAYAIVYHTFAGVMGVPAAEIVRNQPTFEHMLGLVRGRVYYNLDNWYRLVGLFPGARLNAGFMESMMGVRESAAAAAAPRAPAWRRWFVEGPRALRVGATMAWRFLRLDRLVARFGAHFHEHHDRWAALDVSTLAPHQLVALYREMEAALLWRWQTPIINDFYVMIAYGGLKRWCGAWCGDASGSLQNDLLCGEGGIESAAPTRDLLRLAALVRADPALAERIRTAPVATLVADVLHGDAAPALRAALQDHLARYGLRCANELKLESPTLRDAPGFLFEMLRNYLAASPGQVDVAAMEARERETRAAAERRAFAALRGHPFRRWAFRRALAGARRGVRHRENMRFARTRIFGLVRELFRALGVRLAAEGVLATADDVFYLTMDECFGFVDGTAVTTRLRDLVALRRAEFDGWRAGPAPADRFRTHGMVAHRNAYRGTGGSAPPPTGEGLRGVPCAPGTVEARTRFVAEPAAATGLAGEILVAERTDPGWVPLYPSISGLLIQRGSILSHSAVVAREMGIPTIVGIPGLVERLPTGTRVRMDGRAGTVEILPGADGTPPAPPTSSSS